VFKSKRTRVELTKELKEYNEDDDSNYICFFFTIYSWRCKTWRT